MNLKIISDEEFQKFGINIRNYKRKKYHFKLNSLILD